MGRDAMGLGERMGSAAAEDDGIECGWDPLLLRRGDCTRQTPHSMHCASITTHRPLLTSHCSLLAPHCPLLAPHYPPPTTHYPPPTTHHLLPTTHHPPPSTRHSLPTTHCSLLRANEYLRKEEPRYPITRRLADSEPVAEELDAHDKISDPRAQRLSRRVGACAPSIGYSAVAESVHERLLKRRGGESEAFVRGGGVRQSHDVIT